MSKIPSAATDLPALNVVARRVLLDALIALKDHSQAVTIVGAQAVYLRSVEVELAVAAFTSDADLGIDPVELSDDPLLEEVMESAGFAQAEGANPGAWLSAETVGGVPVMVPVDLLVAESFAAGNRGARIPPHHKSTTRRVSGIEAAAVDRDTMRVSSLDPLGDPRVVETLVAGPAALFVAKAFKIRQRADEKDRRRLTAKDSGDVARLMMSDAGEPRDVADRFARLLRHSRTAEVTGDGLRFLDELLRTPNALGVDQAVLALGDESARQLIPAYLRSLQAEIGSAWPV